MSRRMKTSVIYLFMPTEDQPHMVSVGSGPKSPLVIRVLDSGRGCSARGVPLYIAMKESGAEQWQHLEEGVTNGEGSATMLYNTTLPHSATYRLEVDSATYFAASGQEAFCQRIETTFRLSGREHQQQISIHLSPAGYSLHLG
ncbi:hypothetical protein ACOMHN_005192 [Nucella lapillus]